MCRQLGQTDTAGAGPIQTTAECSPSTKVWVCVKGGHKTESCAGGEGKGKPWGLARDQGVSLEQELAGNAFATLETMYPSGQGTGTPPRGDWKHKMGTEVGAKELKAAAEAKIGSFPV